MLHQEPMRLEDIDDVLSIEQASFASPWSRNMFLEEMKNRSSRLVVFKNAEEMVGYACYWVVLDEAHLLNIAVHPERRRECLGKLMMAQIEATCLDKGLMRIILEVARRNIPARALYRACGFTSIGFRRNYYTVAKDDAIVMEKRLARSEEQESPEAKADTP
jgi:[ribosomal protein S18]-alanine N-acetyltransferase